MYSEDHRVAVVAGGVTHVPTFEIAFARMIVGALTIRLNVRNHPMDDAAISGAGVKVGANIASRCDGKFDGHHLVLAV